MAGKTHFFLPFYCALVWAQSSPSLQIVSPSTGVLVAPGQSVSIAVAASGTFSQVGIVADDPIGFSGLATAAPYQFSMPIPAGTPVGPYHFTAVGYAGQSALVESAPITVYVERPDNPTALTVDPAAILFEAQGEQLALHVEGTFGDGSAVDLTRSSQLAFTSSNSAVATVTPEGNVTALSMGNSVVSITYGRANAAGLAVTVGALPVTASPSALAFAPVAAGNTGSAQTVMVTNNSSIPLTFASVAVTGDFQETDTCAGKTIVAGGTCTASVKFAPTIGAHEGGQLTIADGFDVLPLVVPLAGTGIATASGTLTAAITRSGDLSLGETGITYSITVANIGAGAFAGNVTVQEVAPPALTLTGLGGTGWNCALALAQCSRADGLAAGDSFPPLTATFNVSGNAAQSISNTVTVAYTSGPGAVSYTAVDTAPVPPLLQTIAFAPLNNVGMGILSFAVSAQASSGLPVSFSSTTPAVCTVVGAIVTVLAEGVCTITASQAGDASYPAAIPVSRSFTVSALWQIITFPAIDSVQLGNQLALSASSSSGLPVSFASTTPSICQVSGGSLGALALGTCSITASQAGNATYQPAAPAALSFPVTPNACDLHQQGTTTVADVQTIINEALGEAEASNDFSGAGVVAVVDVQIEINSVLTLTCFAAHSMRERLR